MARFNASMADKYKPASSGSFFSLQNDGDYETVRLLYKDMNDVELFSVHEVEVNGNTYWVNCLREYNQPVDDCPLCKAGNKLQVKMWVPLYIENTKEVKIWERGRTFVSKLETASRRYAPLYNYLFDIERRGKKGDQNTTYELIYVPDEVEPFEQLENRPEIPDVEGTIVKSLTKEQMEQFLQTGNIPGMDNAPKTRNVETDRRPSSNADTPVTRRTARGMERPKTDLF